eukprot:scaffold37416_cov32-Tisochrysis_lutea.AAC.2
MNWCTTATRRWSTVTGTCDHQRVSSAPQLEGMLERSDSSGSSVCLWYCGSSRSGLASSTKNCCNAGPSSIKSVCAICAICILQSRLSVAFINTSTTSRFSSPRISWYASASSSASTRPSSETSRPSFAAFCDQGGACSDG